MWLIADFVLTYAIFSTDQIQYQGRQYHNESVHICAINFYVHHTKKPLVKQLVDNIVLILNFYVVLR